VRCNARRRPDVAASCQAAGSFISRMIATRTLLLKGRPVERSLRLLQTAFDQTEDIELIAAMPDHSSRRTRCRLDLLVPNEQERGCLGILQRLFLCARILCGRGPPPFMRIAVRFGLPNVPHFCARMSRGSGLSVHLHSCRISFFDLCWSDFYGLLCS